MFLLNLRRRFRVLCVSLVSVAALLSTTGCIAVAVGAGAAGAVAYVRGELSSPLNASIGRSQTATETAIAQLGFAKVVDRRDALEGIFIARTAADKKVEIKLRKVGENVSNIRIRVGLFGDEQMSLAVLDKVKANL